MTFTLPNLAAIPPLQNRQRLWHLRPGEISRTTVESHGNALEILTSRFRNGDCICNMVCRVCRSRANFTLPPPELSPLPDDTRKRAFCLLRMQKRRCRLTKTLKLRADNAPLIVVELVDSGGGAIFLAADSPGFCHQACALGRAKLRPFV
jgi:hypothetical protein